jgi:hypothetical protein
VLLCDCCIPEVLDRSFPKRKRQNKGKHQTEDREDRSYIFWEISAGLPDSNPRRH